MSEQEAIRILTEVVQNCVERIALHEQILIFGLGPLLIWLLFLTFIVVMLWKDKP